MTLFLLAGCMGIEDARAAEPVRHERNVLTLDEALDDLLAHAERLQPRGVDGAPRRDERERGEERAAADDEHREQRVQQPENRDGDRPPEPLVRHARRLRQGHPRVGNPCGSGESV